MRLLHTQTLEIHNFVGKDVPEYVILSHTWEEEEVSLSDMQSNSAEAKKGYRKLLGFCKKAAEDGYAYCWMDTCCIDKTSSAELSEAINSMYQYYRRCQICYVYLSDVEKPSQIEYARWWSRGWTLQELIAPTIVEFYSAHWLELGTRLTLAPKIAKHTGIDDHVLKGGDPTVMSVATRMSWAAQRTTTRIEDEAYCLLGLFGIHMPLLYGEGHAAFRRLQEHIIRAYEDHSLLVWSPTAEEEMKHYSKREVGLLAHSPRNFAALRARKDGKSIKCDFRNVDKGSWKPHLFGGRDALSSPWALTSMGLRITLPASISMSSPITVCLATLRIDDEIYLVCANLQSGGDTTEYHRYPGEVFLLRKDACLEFAPRTLYVYQPLPLSESWSGSAELQNSVPTLLTVKILSTIPDAPITCVSRLACVENIETDRYVSEQVYTRQYMDLKDYLGVMLCAIDPKRSEDTIYLSEISMGDPSLCFILQSIRPKHALKFGPKDQRNIRVSVDLDLSSATPSCEAVLVAPTDVEHRELPKTRERISLESDEMPRNDRSEVIFSWPGSDAAPLYTSEQRVSVSVRRAPSFHPHPASDYGSLMVRDASLPRSFKRFVLTIKHDRVSWWHTNDIDFRGMHYDASEKSAASSTAARHGPPRVNVRQGRSANLGEIK